MYSTPHSTRNAIAGAPPANGPGAVRFRRIAGRKREGAAP